MKGREVMRKCCVDMVLRREMHMAVDFVKVMEMTVVNTYFEKSE